MGNKEESSKLTTKIIITILTLASLSFVAGIIWSSVHVEGSFESWRSLKSPPEKAVHLLNTDGNNIWVETENKSIYYTNYDCHKDGCWIKTDSLPNEDDMSYYSKENGEECNNLGFYPVSQPENSIECISIHYDAVDIVTHYVLMDDGTIWVWSHSFGGITDVEPEKCFIGICSGPIGLILGLLVAILLYRKKKV